MNRLEGSSHKLASEQDVKIAFPGDDWPPTMEKADIHIDSNCIGILDESNETRSAYYNEGKVEVCGCCGLPKQPEKISGVFTKSIYEVETIGVSTLLFFQFTKQAMCLMFVNCLIYSAYSIITNIIFNVQSPCYSSGACSSIMTMGITMKVNSGKTPVLLVAQAWLNLVLVLVWIVQLVYIKKKFITRDVKLDREIVSASDYSAMLYNLPSEEGYTKEDVRQAIKNFYEAQPVEVEVANVNIAFEIEEYTHLSNTMRRYNYLRKNGQADDIDPEQASETERLYHEKWAQIETERKMYSENKLKPGLYTVVTFQTSQMLADFLKRTKVGVFKEEAIYYFQCLLKYFDSKSLNVKGNTIVTSRAPQPQNIIWQNSGVSKYVVMEKKAVSYLVTIILLGASFAAIYGLSLAQSSKSLVLSFVVSISITVINLVIKKLLHYFTLFEKAITKSNFEKNLAFKVVLAQLMNSVLVLTIVGYFIKDKEQGLLVFGRGGLIEDVFMTSITTSLLPPFLLYFADVEEITRSFKYCYYTQVITRGQCFQSQRQVNKALQHSHFHIGQAYVTVVVIVLYNCFFSAMQPVISFFATVGLFLIYHVTKFLVLVRYSRPEFLGDYLNESMFQLLSLAPFFLSFGQLLMTNLFTDFRELLVPNLICIGISVINGLLPLDTIFDAIMGEPTCEQNSIPFSDARLSLLDDYDRSNPVTHEKALDDYMKLVNENKNKLSPKQLQILNYINYTTKIQEQNEGQKLQGDAMFGAMIKQMTIKKDQPAPYTPIPSPINPMYPPQYPMQYPPQYPMQHPPQYPMQYPMQYPPNFMQFSQQYNPFHAQFAPQYAAQYVVGAENPQSEHEGNAQQQPAE